MAPRHTVCGFVQQYDAPSGSGVVASITQDLYHFETIDWRCDARAPAPGVPVEFMAINGCAHDVWPLAVDEGGAVLDRVEWSYARDLPLERAAYCPPEPDQFEPGVVVQEGAATDVLYLPLESFGVDLDVVQPGRVTICAGTVARETAYGYEFDISPDTARLLAMRLLKAADKCTCDR